LYEPFSDHNFVDRPFDVVSLNCELGSGHVEVLADYFASVSTKKSQEKEEKCWRPEDDM
jgi:hypothetical protein